MNSMHDEHLDLFQRGIAAAQLAAADREETGAARQIYLAGLITGLSFALGETMTDAELRAALSIVADLAGERRAHNQMKAN